MKNFIIIGNWKLNGNSFIISNFFYQLKKYFIQNILLNTVIIAPPAIYLSMVQNIINSPNFFLGAQNVDVNQSGSFTGEISAEMLKDVGAKYIIIGHSERRIYHQENDNIVTKKFKLLKNLGLTPILCIGENLEEKKNNYTRLICQKQIDSILEHIGENAFQDVIIAYEPIWAIGSGQSADPEYVQNIHKFIKCYISDNSNTHYNDIIVQYGGSINDKNVLTFLSKNDIDGVLLGGSALIYKQFIKIIEIAENIKK